MTCVHVPVRAELHCDYDDCAATFGPGKGATVLRENAFLFGWCHTRRHRFPRDYCPAHAWAVKQK